MSKHAKIKLEKILQSKGLALQDLRFLLAYLVEAAERGKN